MAEEVKNKNGVEFDIDAIVTDLNGKADKDLANININTPVFARKLEEAGINYVIETGFSDDNKSWYRLWTDGWCEQGGQFPQQAWANVVVLLLKSYATSTYTIATTGAGYTANTDGWSIVLREPGQFKVYGYNNTGFSTWYACGYTR